MKEIFMFFKKKCRTTEQYIQDILEMSLEVQFLIEHYQCTKLNAINEHLTHLGNNMYVLSNIQQYAKIILDLRQKIDLVKKHQFKNKTELMQLNTQIQFYLSEATHDIDFALIKH